MATGPEANFWNQIRSNLPKGLNGQRIENKSGGGIPDVNMLWDGLPFWLELKTVKTTQVKISPHQIAWHTSYAHRNGLSFFLIKTLGTRSVFLFSGSEALVLATKGLSEAQGSRFEGLAPCFAALRPLVLEHYALRLASCALRLAP